MSSAFNQSQQRALATHVRVARSLVSRFIGLLGTKSLAAGEGLWIEPCQSVHTFFMRYPIDVIFLSKTGVVLYLATLPPWRVTRWVRGARGVLELAARASEENHAQLGDTVHLQLEDAR